MGNFLYLSILLQFLGYLGRFVYNKHGNREILKNLLPFVNFLAKNLENLEEISGNSGNFRKYGKFHTFDGKFPEIYCFHSE